MTAQSIPARVCSPAQRDPMAFTLLVEFLNDFVDRFIGLIDEGPVRTPGWFHLQERMKIALNFSQFDRQARMFIHG